VLWAVLPTPTPKKALPLRVPMTFSEEAAQAQWKVLGCQCRAFPGAGWLDNS